MAARTLTPAPSGAPLGSIPRQQRGIEKRDRIYHAAMNEYARHGVRGSRVEDIVAAAEVGWGTFFHYFPRKEDVLLAAGVEMQEELEAFIASGLKRKDVPVGEIVFQVYEHLARPKHPHRLHVAMIREILASSGRFYQMLGELRPLYEGLAQLLHEGQLRNEVRADLPAATLARILNLGIMVTVAGLRLSDEPTSTPHEAGLAETVHSSFQVLWAGIEVAAEGRPAVAMDVS
jgi:AcrR family transcriptional regulator